MVLKELFSSLEKADLRPLTGTLISLGGEYWDTDLPGEGEKIFTDVRLVNSYFGFVTYQPVANRNKEAGSNRNYLVDAVTGEQNTSVMLKNRTPALAPTIRLMDQSQISIGGKGIQGSVFVLCAGDERVMVPGETIQQTGWIEKRVSMKGWPT